MPKYHMSDGEPKPCSAGEGNCPLGANGEEPPHFTGNIGEARTWAEEQNAENAGGNLPDNTRSTQDAPAEKPPLPAWLRDSESNKRMTTQQVEQQEKNALAMVKGTGSDAPDLRVEKTRRSKKNDDYRDTVISSSDGRRSLTMRVHRDPKLSYMIDHDAGSGSQVKHIRESAEAVKDVDSYERRQQGLEESVHEKDRQAKRGHAEVRDVPDRRYREITDHDTREEVVEKQHEFAESYIDGKDSPADGIIEGRSTMRGKLYQVLDDSGRSLQVSIPHDKGSPVTYGGYDDTENTPRELDNQTMRGISGSLRKRSEERDPDRQYALLMQDTKDLAHDIGSSHQQNPTVVNDISERKVTVYGDRGDITVQQNDDDGIFSYSCTTSDGRTAEIPAGLSTGEVRRRLRDHISGVFS